MAAEQGKDTPAGRLQGLNIEQVYTTTVPAEEFGRAGGCLQTCLDPLPREALGGLLCRKPGCATVRAHGASGPHRRARCGGTHRSRGLPGGRFAR